MKSRFLLFFIFLSFCSFFAAQTFKAKKTAAAVGSALIFTWSDLPDTFLDPRVMFWQKGKDPSVDDGFIDDSWSYTYGGTTKQGKYSTKSGEVAVQVPTRDGLYNVFYCYDQTNKTRYCPYSVPISIVKCKGKDDSTSSTVKNIITIVTENHSFDSIYGKYCKAPSFSAPKCNEGPECCEAIPDSLNGIKPFTLTDVQNLRHDPCHTTECEISEMNGGKMDKYIFGGLGAHPGNYASCSGEVDSCEYYYSWVRKGAMADRFFQSSPGSSTQSNMYYSNGRFIFKDNSMIPQSKNFRGSRCYGSNFVDYNIPTVADLLNACSTTWTWYAEGYDEDPSDKQCYPLYYDSNDDPFTFFSSLLNSPTSEQNFRDLTKLYQDILEGTLPSVSYVKGLGIHSEHPSYSLNEGQRMAQRIIDAVTSSALYSKNTVIFIVPDESGGYYDHIPPPNTSTIDGMPYGPRTYFVAYGDQVKSNYVSHVEMEPSSIIKFIEWNWLDGTGQLGTRDTVVNNLGDLFDPSKTGIPIPSH